MVTFYLVRHGEADFSLPAKFGPAKGWSADLAPLTAKGIRQVESAVDQLRLLRPEIIVSSPMTRALQSSLILSAALGLSCTVEFDLHEWVPDLSFSWTSLEEVMMQLADFDACGGEWPPAERRPWE